MMLAPLHQNIFALNTMIAIDCYDLPQQIFHLTLNCKTTLRTKIQRSAPAQQHPHNLSAAAEHRGAKAERSEGVVLHRRGRRQLLHPDRARHPASSAGRSCARRAAATGNEARRPPQAHTARARGVKGGDG